MGGLSVEDKHQGRLRGVNFGFGIAGPSHPTVGVPITLVGAHDTRYRCTAELGIVGGPFRSSGGKSNLSPSSLPRRVKNMAQYSYFMVWRQPIPSISSDGGPSRIRWNVVAVAKGVVVVVVRAAERKPN
ncbi:unnamed protein product [Cyprideis torosa]|uniref:Uncharacterized protein n=1 Tax=Cyprideis torosa TaxID=163714 RepID=A0A7R8W406_9CRUS|nr:unnamed protein product [Cyprideis torosa]CAG0883485.1 unnamed protein product [Cyprideis torosa]